MATLLVTSHPRVRSPRALPRRVAFWTVAATTLVLLAASSAPSPLYAVYQARFGFSPLTLTAIFSVYVIALLLSLLTVGRLSDYVGRRPVLAAALLVEAVAMVIFLGAGGVAALYAARIVQGLATGAAVGVLGAYLLDLQPADGSRLGSLVNSAAPTAGLGLGAAGTGVLIQYAPYPTHLVFVALIAAFVLLALVTAVLPESVERQPGAVAALRPQVAVPPRARRAFLRATPTMTSTWALGGLVLSVGGSVVARVFGQTNHAVVGLALGMFAGAGAAAAILTRDLSPERMTTVGTALLLTGTALLVTALATSSFPLFLIGAVVAGSGFGSGFLGALRSVTQLAEPHERAALLSAVYVVSYLALSIPAVIAGLLITSVGLRDTALGYGAFVGLLTLATLAYEQTGALRAARRPVVTA